MQINTKNFGLIEIDEKDIINFPEGIPAFEEEKEFILINHEEDSPFLWLQSVETAELAFVVIDPRLCDPNYFVDVDDSEVEILNIQDVNNVLVLSIVVIPEEVSKMTANFKAPVLINTETNIGKQIVMDNSEYQLKHYILEQLQAVGG